MDENEDVRDDFKDGNEGFNDPGQRGRRGNQENVLMESYKVYQCHVIDINPNLQQEKRKTL